MVAELEKEEWGEGEKEETDESESALGEQCDTEKSWEDIADEEEKQEREEEKNDLLFFDPGTDDGAAEDEEEEDECGSRSEVISVILRDTEESFPADTVAINVRVLGRK